MKLNLDVEGNIMKQIDALDVGFLLREFVNALMKQPCFLHSYQSAWPYLMKDLIFSTRSMLSGS